MNPLASYGFNYLDDVFVVIVLINMVASFREGFIAKVFGLLGLIAAIFAAGHMTYIGTGILKALHVGGPGLQRTLAFAVTFVVILLGSRVAAVVLTRAAGMLMLGMVNRLLGALLGLVEGLVIVVVILFVIVAFKLDIFKTAVQTSRIAHDLGPRYVTMLVGILPPDLHRLMPWIR
ncbi:MAG: hypothetical protein NVSMB65_03710 [Chloroflexota bacterium]